jgi:hypothetical protein
MLVIFILILGFIALGILVRTQNMSMAELTQSVTQVSSNVYDIVKDKQGEIARTGEQFGAKIGNPASQNCLKSGGKWTAEEGPAGQYGVCTMPDGKACEEWALYRGECPEAGVDVSAYSNQADRYCLLTGNDITVEGKEGDAGTCKVGNDECSAQVFFETGKCEAAGE